MNIIIVGATRVGIELAEYLVGGGHAVTLVDRPSEELSAIGNRLDLRVVQDSPSLPSTLKKAGAENAELLVATTDSDETNITACCIAAFLFRVPRKIARIRDHDYLNEADEIFGQNAIPIDHIISPEHITADAIIDLINLPGSSCVGNFAGGRIVLIEARCSRGGKLIGHKVESLLKLDDKVRIVALHRNGEAVERFLNEYIAEGDLLCFCVERSRALSILTALVPIEISGKVITIAGGSHIADELARRLSSRYQVKLIEPNPERALKSADRLQNTSVEIFEANPSNLDFLIEEHINRSARFIAASQNDEDNLVSALMLKSLDSVRTITVLRESSFYEVIRHAEKDVDTVVSPREAIISELLSDILQEGVERVRLYRGGASEGIELTVRGGRLSSRVVGRKAGDLNLPRGVTLALALRDKKVIPIDPDFVFEPDDHVIAYLEEQKSMRALVRLFKPRSFWIMPW